MAVVERWPLERKFDCILKRDETGYNGNPQQAIVLVFLVTVSMQRAVYIFSLVSEKVPRALKFD